MFIGPIMTYCYAFSAADTHSSPIMPCMWIVNQGIKGRIIRYRNRHTIWRSNHQSHKQWLWCCIASLTGPQRFN